MKEPCMPYAVLRARRRLFGAMLLAPLGLAIAGCSGLALAPAPIGPASTPDAGRIVRPAGGYTFKTLDNPDDPSFNQLTGINNVGKICGYYGSGASSEPSVGYIVRKFGNAHYKREKYPGAVDTVVTAVNNQNVIAGYYRADSGGTFGFAEAGGIWSSYKDPHTKGTYNATKLLGLSDSGLAVGYYPDAQGNDHGFELVLTTAQFVPITPPGGVS
ncbi:MAG: hypothetical protein JO092_12165, partial [Candidatus Eremiobacteraeota bacterium]|nr:hypothetical protein [Candidatus Eremiobacteraeota bacterium]